MGGTYDGAAGVVAGLEAILALKPRWSELRHRLQLVAWRGEEIINLRQPVQRQPGGIWAERTARLAQGI